MLKATAKRSIGPRQNESRNSSREVREIMRPNHMILVGLVQPMDFTQYIKTRVRY